MNRILILIPADSARGGITTYYQTLKNYYSNQVIYQYRGSRNFPYRKGILNEKLRLLYDFTIFIQNLFKKNLKVIQTNTSLNPNSVKRDAIFILLAKIFKKQIIIFFHGWDIEFAKKIQNSYLFKKIYFKADAVILLSENSEKTMREWGYDKPIYRVTTAVSNDIIQNITTKTINDKFENNKQTLNLLFLARIEKQKGIYELIDTLEILNKTYNNLVLTIAGDGREEKAIREYISEKNIENVSFTGFVNNEEKIKVFNNNHIYIFPSYTEGMPTSVLEAMAFGLPVITTAVGGLIDFFQNEINGFMSDVPPKPSTFAKNISLLIENQDLMKSIALNNYYYAQANFLASKIAKQNESIFNEVINK
jgi:glycosyltransferase involved in cell wall biosynthesis